MKAFVGDFAKFLDSSCSAFQAVETLGKLYDAAGFTRLAETDNWNLERSGKYYFTRNMATIVAFTVGGAYKPNNGFTVVGAHTDSPCIKIKPKTCSVKHGALVLNTFGYGGGLWHTWFDRDLGLAGRAVVRTAEGGLVTKLVRIDRPIARIPNLCIHMSDSRDSFSPNLHEHCKAIISMDAAECGDSEALDGRLHPCLTKLIGGELGVAAEDIVDLELQLIDTQPTTIGGFNNDMLFSGRLDNLCSSYQCARALVDGADDATDPLASQENIRVALMFDHEEVGSHSATGAGSSLFMDTLTLITSKLLKYDESLGPNDLHSVLFRSLRKSYCVSADMAHALHPNYAAKHDPEMAPRFGKGMVIKTNANQRYATNSVTASMFREFARLENLPVQEFSVRADAGCGSTIGPIMSTLSGIPTIDVGVAQFSMHSIREMMGTADVYIGYAHLKAAFKHHPGLVRKSELEKAV